MPLLQPASRSPRWQARNALSEAGGAGVAAAVATKQAGIAVSAADDAIAAAGVAQDSADQATQQVGQVFTFQQVRDSYADDGILSATTADGASMIAIAAHKRHYLNSPISPNLASGLLTNLLPATGYHVYYDDPSFAGGAVTYQASTAIESALASLEHTARHYVGAVTTPAQGEPVREGTGGTGRPYWKPGQVQQAQQ